MESDRPQTICLSQLSEFTVTARQGCANLPLQDLGCCFIGSPQAEIIIQVCRDFTISVKDLWGKRNTY